MNHPDQSSVDSPVEVRNAGSASETVVVCEHASASIPPQFNNLGLSPSALQSHVAWDPGAIELAAKIAARLDAVLVASKISRLVYDCNRPPEAPDAMPALTEVCDVPGNADLSAAQKAERVATYYEPFRATLAAVTGEKSAPVLVTVHSFTPVFHGQKRDVEIGILHDRDTRLADAMLSMATAHTDHAVSRNEPYGPDDGVTHTLKEHALPGGHLNVMLEVRNDLIADEPAQTTMAEMLSNWLSHAITQAEADSCKI
jgi:predicted N-formylglutamate amidohydrolase